MVYLPYGNEKNICNTTIPWPVYIQETDKSRWGQDKQVQLEAANSDVSRDQTHQKWENQVELFNVEW